VLWTNKVLRQLRSRKTVVCAILWKESPGFCAGAKSWFRDLLQWEYYLGLDVLVCVGVSHACDLFWFKILWQNPCRGVKETFCHLSRLTVFEIIVNFFSLCYGVSWSVKYVDVITHC